jgi:hypothetical protein
MTTLLPWALSVGVVTVRDVRVYGKPPVPGEFVATGVLFGALTILAQANPPLAGVLAWGMLAAIALQAASTGGLTARRTPAQEPKPVKTGGK